MALKFSKLESEVYLLLKAKTPISTIISTLEKSRKTIENTIQRINKKEKEDYNIERVKVGRVTKTSTREKRVINRDLTRSPKKENKRLLVENNLKISTRTLQRVLKEEAYSTHVATKKPIINRDSAKKRLIYVKDIPKVIEEKNLNKVIFLDEAAIQRGHGSRRQYYRKKGNSRVGREMVNSTSKSKFF
jgi:hypothetical protein